MIDYPQIPYSKRCQKIDSGASLVTVNRRLARRLMAEYAAAKTAAGFSVWETPEILPYSVWIEKLYDSLLLNPDLDAVNDFPDPLSPAQELWLWESVISESNYGMDLLQGQATAKTAQEAWAIFQQWGLDVEMLAKAPPPDTEAFIDWVERFVNRLCRQNWVESARLPDFVASGVSRGWIDLPDQILFAGFDEIPPQMAALLSRIQSMGKSVQLLAFPKNCARVGRCEMPDAETEMIHAARWVKQQFSSDPKKRIGVIVPDLQAVRKQLVQIFDDILHPGLVFSTDDNEERLYNFSLGPPLIDYPMIRSALRVLETAGAAVSLDETGRLIRSPFLGGACQEMTSRSRLDAELRKLGETEIGMAHLIEAAENTGCERLCRQLRTLKAAMENFPARQSPSGWAEAFAGMLTGIGWPGDRTLSSVEYQSFDAWQAVLGRFAAMDRVAGDISHHRAIRILKRILSETPFQPETGDLPIQVMGVLESAGESFDAVWVMGLHNENWPPRPRPNPFLPIWLQRKYHILHSSSQRELAYARRITDRLVTCASEVILSSPKRLGDAELFPSPLIRHFPLTAPTFDEASSYRYWREFLAAAAYERVADINGPAVADGDVVSGGTGLLKAQAECPFKAFARYRLRAQALETPAPGLDAIERGRLVHQILQQVWEKLGTHAKLVEIPEDELSLIIKAAVNSEISGMAKSRPNTFTRRFVVLEAERLAALITEWMDQERKRAPFVVRDREASLPITLCGFGLNTFADRIDKLPDGRLVIIDYKTGKPSLRDWFTERMAEPQLPLYVIGLGQPVAAILFGQVRKGEARFIGIADDEGLAPGIRKIESDTRYADGYASIGELIPQWRRQLENLGEEIKSGYAAVSPTDIRTSCRYCDLGPLCRINELEMLESDGEEDR
ncbi:MAG: PD-(D/E)XK nuclease family protein [Desulfobacterales bacterium]|nr:PD-(D/E)XK nuclease family protein [Desulfobacterales bacterium]